MVVAVERVERAVHPTMMQLADDNGENMTAWIKRNTPVESFMKSISEPHLRDRIFTKETIVYVDFSGRKVYETGSETEVDYAPYVEEGTGLWGPSGAKYEIKPRTPTGVLSWIDRETGKRIFAKRVMHPGSPGQHMFAIGAAMAEHEFERASAAGLQQFRQIFERGRAPAAIPIPLIV